MIFLAKGTFYLGHRTHDKDGNTIHEEPPRFEAGEDGGCVLVGILNDDTGEQIGEGTLFGDFDPWGYLGEVMKLLAPKRQGNIPDFESILKKMFNEHRSEDCPLMDYCERPTCEDCIVSQWIEETEAEAKE